MRKAICAVGKVNGPPGQARGGGLFFGNVINSEVIGRVLISSLVSGYGVFVPQLRSASWRS